MAWIWESWDEYVSNVHPVEIINSGHWTTAQYDSLFENDCHLLSAAENLSEALRSLCAMGFTGSRHAHPLAKGRSVIADAYEWVVRAIHQGELLLLYDKDLVQSGTASEFLHAHTLIEHWDRYAKTNRIFIEIDEFVRAVSELVDAHSARIEDRREFLVADLKLPDDLMADFRQARDLFSVGLDQTGLLIASRGLEGVLRRIMGIRKITFSTKQRSTPASEADFHDLIEIAGHLRWKRSGTRLITPDIKQLLHYLRVMRNSGAHPNGGRRLAQSSREIAIVTAQTANQLWKAITSTRARLEPACVIKAW